TRPGSFCLLPGSSLRRHHPGLFVVLLLAVPPPPEPPPTLTFCYLPTSTPFVSVFSTAQGCAFQKRGKM
ncbi:hypothetical protein M9458_037087, partial [Cirrhinus mrigala]